MARPVNLEDWHLEAIALMARTGVGLLQAATELGVRVTNEEANRLLRKPSFQDALWQARHIYFSRLGSDPNWKKDTFVGKMLDLARKLEEEGQHDKAAEVMFKVAKAQNWVGPESTVNVFRLNTSSLLKRSVSKFIDLVSLFIVSTPPLVRLRHSYSLLFKSDINSCSENPNKSASLWEPFPAKYEY